MSKLISIDQSLSKTALVEWVGGKPVAKHLFKSGSSSSKKHLANVRYFDTVDEQMEFITSSIIERVVGFKPSAIVMEGLSFGSIGNATRDLAGLYYVMRNAMYQASYDWGQLHDVSPTSLKAMARNYLPLQLQTVPKPSGKAGTNLVKMEKPLMIAAVPQEHRWLYEGLGMSGIKSGKDDVADAYWLGVYYETKIKGV
jgi:hypothetical protein